MNKFSEIESKVRELSKQYSPHATAYSYAGTSASGWFIWIIDEIERLNVNIESVRAQLDEINRTLANITSATHGQIEKSDKMLEVEECFGKPIEELLAERKGKSFREIANELNVSKSSIANWLKLLKY